MRKRKRATNRQIGGDHYRTLEITPTQYIYANKLSWNIGNTIKYVTRTKEDKVQDLLKAKHYIDLELEMIYGCDPDGEPVKG